MLTDFILNGYFAKNIIDDDQSDHSRLNMKAKQCKTFEYNNNNDNNNDNNNNDYNNNHNNKYNDDHVNDYTDNDDNNNKINIRKTMMILKYQESSVIGHHGTPIH